MAAAPALFGEDEGADAVGSNLLQDPFAIREPDNGHAPDIEGWSSDIEGWDVLVGGG